MVQEKEKNFFGNLLRGLSSLPPSLNPPATCELSTILIFDKQIIPVFLVHPHHKYQFSYNHVASFLLYKASYDTLYPKLQGISKPIHSLFSHKSIV